MIILVGIGCFILGGIVGVAYQKKVLRHEIVHAFLYESGLWQNAYGSKCWAKNEEMIDWMAIQIPKIQRAYKEAYCDE